jgi:hypothetical protein
VELALLIPRGMTHGLLEPSGAACRDPGSAATNAGYFDPHTLFGHGLISWNSTRCQ